MPDPFHPETNVLIKLGSALVHYMEYFSLGGDEIDRDSAERLLEDPELTEWLLEMDKMALLPKWRNG